MENENKPKTKGKKVVILIITILVLLITVAGGVVLLTRNKGNTGEQANHDKEQTTTAKEEQNISKPDYIEASIQKGDISGANPPVLKDGMTAVTFNENGNAEIVEDATLRTWYSYEVTTDDEMKNGGTTNGGNSKWANAVLNGNYYVWIPRYAYKIDKSVNYEENAFSGTSYKVEVKFIGTNVTNANVTIEVGKDYVVHPAFTFGTQELSGFWVGKYETSGTIDKPTILPNINSLRNINVSTMFNTAQKLSTTNNDAHMMKNTEWGAVAFLAQSPYGRNGTEISVNQCGDYMTGAGESIGSEEEILGYTWSNIKEEQKYNGKIGKLASTTGNIYGIYDMSGGAEEYVMGFYAINGEPIAEDTGFTTFPNRKYYDLYTSENDDKNISSALFSQTKWNADWNSFVMDSSPVFIRGGNCKDLVSAGLFNSKDFTGAARNEIGFRVCIATTE